MGERSLLDSTPCRMHEIDGLRVRTRVSGVGRPLLLLNGLGASFELWDPVLEWVEDRQIVVVDVPGVGGSDSPLVPWTMARYADLVATVLDRLAIDRIDVLGFSFGGMLAQELAHRHPSRVRTLILVATSCGWGSMPAALLAGVAIATPLRYYSPTYMNQVASFLYGGKASTPDDPSVVQMEARQANPPTLLGYYSQLFAVWTWSSLPFLHRLRLPTLIITGSADPAIPSRNARQLYRAISGSQMHEIPDAGHLCILDSPEVVLPIITEFLGEHCDSGQDR